MFSIVSLDQHVDLLDGEICYIAISRLNIRSGHGPFLWAECSLGYSGIRTHLTRILGSFLGHRLALLIKVDQPFSKSNCDRQGLIVIYNQSLSAQTKTGLLSMNYDIAN